MKKKKAEINFDAYIPHAKQALIWTAIYSVLLWIFDILTNQILGLLESTEFISTIYFIIMGVFLLLSSNFVNSAIHKRHFSLNSVDLQWSIVYGFVFWVSQLLINGLGYGLPDIKAILFTGFILAILIKFLRRAKIIIGKRPNFAFGSHRSGRRGVRMSGLVRENLRLILMSCVAGIAVQSFMAEKLQVVEFFTVNFTAWVELVKILFEAMGVFSMMGIGLFGTVIQLLIFGVYYIIIFYALAKIIWYYIAKVL